MPQNYYHFFLENGANPIKTFSAPSLLFNEYVFYVPSYDWVALGQSVFYPTNPRKAGISLMSL
jgi:hypothetical protein